MIIRKRKLNAKSTSLKLHKQHHQNDLNACCNKTQSSRDIFSPIVVPEEACLPGVSRIASFSVSSLSYRIHLMLSLFVLVLDLQTHFDVCCFYSYLLCCTLSYPIIASFVFDVSSSHLDSYRFCPPSHSLDP